MARKGDINTKLAHTDEIAEIVKQEIVDVLPEVPEAVVEPTKGELPVKKDDWFDSYLALINKVKNVVAGK